MAPSFIPRSGTMPQQVDCLKRAVETPSLAFAQGYDMALRFNTDGLGMTYIGLVVAWTCLLLPAAIFLIKNRHLPHLRMRNIPLSVGAVATLHIYWVLCMIAYVLNGYFPCATEYWIMSIYLPLGIALFQATNCQLLSIATAQQKYTRRQLALESKQTNQEPQLQGLRKWWEKLKAYNATKSTVAWIGIGMSIQVRSRWPLSNHYMMLI